MQWVQNPFAEFTTFTYDNASRLTQQRLGNSTRATHAYDAADRLMLVQNLKSDNTVLSSFNYQYDKVGNRTSVVESNGDRVTWIYDLTYRLRNEHRSGANAYNTTHTYDSLGNRTVQQQDGALTTYSYDPANQLQTSRDVTGLTTYTYDGTGNLQLTQDPTGGRTTYTWNIDNRLTTLVLAQCRDQHLHV